MTFFHLIVTLHVLVLVLTDDTLNLDILTLPGFFDAAYAVSGNIVMIIATARIIARAFAVLFITPTQSFPVCYAFHC